MTLFLDNGYDRWTHHISMRPSGWLRILEIKSSVALKLRFILPLNHLKTIPIHQRDSMKSWKSDTTVIIVIQRGSIKFYLIIAQHCIIHDKHWIDKCDTAKNQEPRVPFCSRQNGRYGQVLIPKYLLFRIWGTIVDRFDPSLSINHHAAILNHL